MKTTAKDGDVSFPINQKLLEEATRLKEERRVLRERLEKVDATKGDVSASVYERVKHDYTKRFDETSAALMQKKDEIDRELATLNETRRKVTVNLESHKEILEEIQLRHSLGEFGKDDFQEKASQAGDKIQKFEKLLSAVNNNIQCYEALFASEPDLSGTVERRSVVNQPLSGGEGEVTRLPADGVVAGAPEIDEDYMLEEGDGYFHATAAVPDRKKEITANQVTGETGTPVAGATITIVRGRDSGKVVPVLKETSIGRASNNAVVLKEAKVSRQHAVIRQQGSQYIIEDLQSSNGLFVNGEKALQRVIEDGDTIDIGDFVLRFRNPKK